jgi:protein ImuB
VAAPVRTLVVVCPGLACATDDPDRAARAFEPVVAAAEEFTPRVEVRRAGMCAFPTRGPSRYFGGDEALARRVAERVDREAGPSGLSCRVGIADGPFAAELAAARGVVVPPGASAAFLAPLPVSSLAFCGVSTTSTVVKAPQNAAAAELADLLQRLGIRTLGDLAALPAPAVLGRFGLEGATAHRLARGLDDRPLRARTPPPDLTVVAELDPPVDQVDAVAFVAKTLADRLDELLSGQGLVATRVGIEIETEHGESLSRLWRHDGGLTPAALAQRARWQLDGWLTRAGVTPLSAARAGSPLSAAQAYGGPTAGFTRLRLVPDEVGPAKGRQVGFWGGQRDGDERAGRALARVQGMLGPDAVVMAVEAGGRAPGEQVGLVPWGDSPPISDHQQRPWPGRVPSPAPATIFTRPVTAEVIDRYGSPVLVNGRGHAVSEPARLSIAGGHWTEVIGWAGPWPLDERWWDSEAHRRQARWQIVTADGAAHLLIVEHGRWSVEGSYD